MFGSGNGRAEIANANHGDTLVDVPQLYPGAENLLCLATNRRVVITDVISADAVARCGSQFLGIKFDDAVVQQDVALWADAQDVLGNVVLLVLPAERLNVVGLSVLGSVGQRDRISANLTIEVVRYLDLSSKLGIAENSTNRYLEALWRYEHSC